MNYLQLVGSFNCCYHSLQCTFIDFKICFLNPTVHSVLHIRIFRAKKNDVWEVQCKDTNHITSDCSVMYQTADGSFFFSFITQVPITSGDSGSLPCSDMLSVLCHPPFLIYLFVFNHSHSVDQKPWDNELAMAIFFSFLILFSPSKVGPEFIKWVWVLEPHSSFSVLYL